MMRPEPKHPDPRRPDPRPDDILAALPARIHTPVLAQAALQPDAPALDDARGHWTYRALAAAIVAGRDFLVSRGVRGGDRVMIVTENCREAVALLLACSACDAWAVLVNARLTETEILGIHAHAQPRLVLAVAVSPQVRAHAVTLGLQPCRVAGIGDILAGDADAESVAEPVQADGALQCAALLYTSGTSGTPKGVMLSHRNLLYMAAVSGAIRGLVPDDRMLAVLPVSHIVGLAVVLLGALMHGASIRLLLRFTPNAFFQALAEDDISIVLGAPALLSLVLDHARAHDRVRCTAPRLRIISVSGAPLEQNLKVQAENFFGLRLHHGYGITECGPTIAQIRPGAERADCGVGPLLPGVEARLRDPDGGPAAGDSGELFVRSPSVMLGYFRDPARTAEVLDASGWYRTGDLARLSADNLAIIGRAKSLIIRFGFNVVPEEVEAVLAAHPGVLRAAVIGQPGEGGEDIIAFVEPRSLAALDAAALAQHAAAHLASYKRPTQIFILPALPLTPTGKIHKPALLAEAAPGRPLQAAI